MLSGDTALSANLVENARGADVLVSESLVPGLVAIAGQMMTTQGNPRIAKVMADIPDYHVTPVDAAKMANDAGVKLLVYNHHIPSTQVGTPAYFAGVANVRPADQWVAGWDGLRVDLPVGSAEIKQGSLLPKP